MNVKLTAGPWIEWSEDYLEKTPVVEVELFEKDVMEAFKKDMTDVHAQNLHGTARTRALNLTDHVKANLTRRGLIRYVTVGERRFIVWLRPVGSIHGDHLVYYTDAVKVVAALVAALSPSLDGVSELSPD